MFENTEFWRAVGAAANGLEASVRSLGTKHKITIRPAIGRQGQAAIGFHHPLTNRQLIFDDDVLSVTLDSPAAREAALRQNKHWFDCPADLFEQAVAKIVSTDNVERRIEELGIWRNSSAVVYYTGLHQQLMNNHKFKVSDLLPPSYDGLLRYLRLPSNFNPDQPFSALFDQSASNLLRDEGLEIAILRLWSCPVAMPRPVLSAVTSLSKADRRKLIKKLLKFPASPISRLHVLTLVALCMEDSPLYNRLARRLIKALISVERLGEHEAFKSILAWVNEEFGHSQEIRQMAPQPRLALVWAHAHMLSATLLAAGVSADWIRDRFAKLGDRLPYELFHRDPSYWFDISHPRHIDRPTFIFSGLFYALGKEARRFVDNHIHDALIRAAYQVVEGVPVLTLPLFKDPSLASNSLQSFLGCDRGEIFFHLLGPEHSPTECRDSLVAITEQSIKRLAENPNDLGSWARIFAIIGDMHPYKETIGSMATLLKQIDFTKLTNCQIAMFAATAWAVNIGDDELRKYLKQQLFKICELKGGARGGVDNGKPSELEKGALLLESALNLARAMYPRELLHSEFSDIVRGMVKAWPALVPVFRPVAQRLCDELPMSAARELYPLLLQLRAS